MAQDTLTRHQATHSDTSWRSKVDGQGQTHIYKKITAGDLQVGDHLLEHVLGHKRQVATPILGVEHISEGVIVTIPDRSGDNAPVRELYGHDDPVFISKTPHLEQYNADEDIFVQLDKRSEDMEHQQQNRIEIATKGVEVSWVNIDTAMEELLQSQNAIQADTHAKSVKTGAVDLSRYIIVGADAVAESIKVDAEKFVQWNRTLTDSANRTRAHSEKLEDFGDKIADVAMQRAAAYAQGALDTATTVAIGQRQRTFVMYLDSPIAETILDDARSMGVLDQPKPEEKGVLLAKIPPEAVLAREDGTLVAVPMAPQELKRLENHTEVHLKSDEIGVYKRSLNMEKKPQQYPRLEGHLKEPDGTWRHVGFYVDKDNQPRAVVSIENKDTGLQEKHSMTFKEKVSEQTQKPFLVGSAERENGKKLFVTIHAAEKDQDKWVFAHFAEKSGQDWQQVPGRGGTLKQNEAMKRLDTDRTSDFIKDKLGVDVKGLQRADQGHKRALSGGMTL